MVKHLSNSQNIPHVIKMEIYIFLKAIEHHINPVWKICYNFIWIINIIPVLIKAKSPLQIQHLPSKIKISRSFRTVVFFRFRHLPCNFSRSNKFSPCFPTHNLPNYQKIFKQISRQELIPLWSKARNESDREFQQNGSH